MADQMPRRNHGRAGTETLVTPPTSGLGRKARLMMARPFVALAFPVMIATLAAQMPAEPPIASALSHIPAAVVNSALEGELPALDRFYSKRQYQPLWTTGAALTTAGESALRELRAAGDEGLNVDDYLVTPIAALAEKRDPAKTADLEVLVSLATTRYAHDLGWGITLASEVDRDNAYITRPFAPDQVLETLAAAPDAGAALRAYEPRTFVYRELKLGLAQLRATAAAGGWKSVADGPALKAGDSGPRVSELRARLVERGDLPASAAAGDLFDADLTAGVKRFQERHGLTPDGVYGQNVIRELNVPLATRIQQLRLAMERLRWLPPTSSGRRVAVNLADFKAYVFDGDTITFETRAVVGKQFHETPMFTSMMTYVVINPYWNVPASITRSEILPKIKADPDYLAKNHMEMEDNTVRQLPGPWNSLGRFKFMFPNPHNVYLHDTPARTLFAQPDRAFSHGCVRLEKPAELAALLLGDQGWTAHRIQATINAGQQTVVSLRTPIPVTISYATAFRTPDGLLHYRRDVYGRDRKLLAALTRRSQGSWEE